jgi:hypothetical protein
MQAAERSPRARKAGKSAGDLFLTWRNVAHSKDPVSATQYSFRQLVKICFGKIVKLKSFVARAVNRAQKTWKTGMPKRQFVPHRHSVAMHKRRKNGGMEKAGKKAEWKLLRRLLTQIISSCAGSSQTALHRSR